MSLIVKILSSLRTPVRPLLALFLFFMSSIFVIMLFFVEAPAANENLIFAAFGYVMGGLTIALNFYFGSSDGSKRKEAALQKVSNTTPDKDKP